MEQSLPLRIAKAGVDYYFREFSSRHIRFYGPGEPTQEFSLMKDITAYAQKKSPHELLVEIQTNGCFSKTVRAWMLDNMNIMWISFDGEPEIQNKNRPFPGGRASAPMIEENVKWLIENRGERNLMVGARVTMTNENIDRQKEMLDYFVTLGIKYIGLIQFSQP